MVIVRRKLGLVESALSILLLCFNACDKAVDAPAAGVLQAMAPDGTHVIVGFPDVLADPSRAGAISIADDLGMTYTIDSTAMDSLSGTLLTLTLSPPYSLSATLSVTVRDFRYERGEPVSDRPVTITTHAGLLYDREMAPFFARHCNSCHGPSVASGNYRTDSRDSLYAFGSDEAGLDRSPNLIPGNDRCQLAVKTGYHGREFRRAALNFFDAELVRQWILNGDAKNGPMTPSTPGILAQASGFTHVRIWFSSAPDPTEASEATRYHLVDIDTPGPELIPSGALVDQDYGTMVELAVPDQKLFHHYALTVDSLRDRFGSMMFDSASATYRALLSYQADVAPLCERACNRCHAPAVPDSSRGFYRTDSYSALFAFGSDSLSGAPIRNLIATDSLCLLLVKTRQSLHKTGLCALRAPLTPLESRLISDWIVSFFARQQ